LKETPTLFLEFTGPSEASLKEDLSRSEEICKANQSTSFQPGVGREERIDCGRLAIKPTSSSSEITRVSLI